MKKVYISAIFAIIIIGIVFVVLFSINQMYVSHNKNNSSSNQSSIIKNQSSIAPQNSSKADSLISSVSMQNSSALPVSQTHRFVFFADTRGDNNGVNKTVLTKILQLIKALSPQPEYIIAGGDLVGGSTSDSAYTSQLQNFKGIMTAYYPMKMILPGFGNHEEIGSYNNSHEKIFQNIFNEFPKTSSLNGYYNTVYYVDDGDVRLIMLNSDFQGQSHEIANAQLDWLKSSTKAGNNMIKIAFLHEPAYPTGANIGYSLDVLPAKRDDFWQVIDNNNVMALFCGHEHNYSRRIIDKSFSSLYTRPVNQITAGTAGAPIYTQYTSKKGVVVPPNPVYHFAIIDIGKSSTTITAISIDSKVIDKFTLQNIY